MSLADELNKLEDLRRRGVLSDAEFEKAKASVLAGPPGETPVAEHLSAQLAEVRYQNDLARLDREWEIEREQYMVEGKYGRRYLPTPGGSLGMAVVGGVFGIFWTIMTVSMMFAGPAEEPFRVASCLFPLFGVLLTCFAVSLGVNAYAKAQKYQEALARYQRRRSDVRSGQFGGQAADGRKPVDDRFTT